MLRTLAYNLLVKSAVSILSISAASAPCGAQDNPASGEWVFKQYLIDGRDVMAGLAPPKGRFIVDTGYYVRINISRDGRKIDVTFIPGPDAFPPTGSFGISDPRLAPTSIHYRTDKKTDVSLPNAADVFTAAATLQPEGFSVTLWRETGALFATETWTVSGEELSFQVDYAAASKMCRTNNDCFDYKQSKRLYRNKHRRKT